MPNSGSRRLSRLMADGTINKSHITSANEIGIITTSVDAQRIFDHTESAGVTNGGDLTDLSATTPGLIQLSSAECYIRAIDDSSSSLYVAVVPEELAFQLNLGYNIVYVDYNAGSPKFMISSIPTDITITNKVPAYEIFFNGISIHIRDARNHNVDNTAKHQKHMFFTEREKRASGATLGSSTGLKVSVTSGEFWFQLNRMSSDAFDTNALSTYNRYYRDGAGGFIEQTGKTDVDNLYYDNDTGLLDVNSEIANAKFGVEWFYLIVDSQHSHLVAMYGQDSYASSVEAELASSPADVPDVIKYMGILIGKTIVQKASLVLTDTLSSFEQSFSGSQVQFHNNLGGLNDSDFVHLTADEKINSDKIDLSAVTSVVVNPDGS